MNGNTRDYRASYTRVQILTGGVDNLAATRVAAPLHNKLVVYAIIKLVVGHSLYLSVIAAPAIDCGFDGEYELIKNYPNTLV